jgi:hypothetical protein
MKLPSEDDQPGLKNSELCPISQRYWTDVSNNGRAKAWQARRKPAIKIVRHVTKMLGAQKALYNVVQRCTAVSLPSHTLN